MEGLKVIPYLALAICISGVILGAGSISLGKFGDTMDKCYNSTFTWNSTAQACTVNNETEAPSASEPGRNLSVDYWVVWNAAEGEGDVAEQLPTVAIIGVMVVIISILAGVFVYMRYFG